MSTSNTSEAHPASPVQHQTTIKAFDVFWCPWINADRNADVDVDNSVHINADVDADINAGVDADTAIADNDAEANAEAEADTDADAYIDADANEFADDDIDWCCRCVTLPVTTLQFCTMFFRLSYWYY